MQNLESKTELEYFYEQIPQELLNLIKKGTEQNCRRKMKDSKQHFINNEFELFLGCVLILMGSGISSINKLFQQGMIQYIPIIQDLFTKKDMLLYLSSLTCFTRDEPIDYWVTHELLNNEEEQYEEEQYENEIQNNEQNIQVVIKEQNSDQSNSCLNNIVKSINLLRQHWRQFQELQDFYVIDESMLAFKGRSKNTVIIPHKPTPKGFKFFCICNTKTSYCYDFFMHQHNIQDNRIYIFNNLLNPIYKKFQSSFTVIADNYFICSKVFENAQNRYKILGTIKKNMYTRNKDMDKIKDGQSICIQQEKFYVTEVKLKNKKQFQFGHTIQYQQLKHPKNAGKQKFQVFENSFSPVEIYNEHYHGVDKFDQYLSYIRWPLRTKRWNSLVTVRLLQMSLINAFIKFQKDTKKKKVSMCQFKDRIASQLITIHLSQLRKREGYQQFMNQKHSQMKTDYSNNSQLSKYNRCSICQKIRTEYCCRCGIPVCMRCFAKHIIQAIYERYHINFQLQ